VLILLDDIDAFIFNGFAYKDKKMKSVTKGDITLGNSRSAEQEKEKKKYSELLDLIKDRLHDDVKDVRFSGRLVDSPCCLVSDEGDIDPQTEKLLRAMGQDIPAAKRILEINASHRIFQLMNTIFLEDKNSRILKDYIDLIYNQALILEGSKPKDPLAFTKIIARLMVECAQKNSG